MSEALIEQWRRRADAALDRWLPGEETLPQTLHRAMRYAVFNGGKRIRPVLTYATGHSLCVPEARLDASSFRSSWCSAFHVGCGCP